MGVDLVDDHAAVEPLVPPRVGAQASQDVAVLPVADDRLTVDHLEHLRQGRGFDGSFQHPVQDACLFAIDCRGVDVGVWHVRRQQVLGELRHQERLRIFFGDEDSAAPIAESSVWTLPAEQRRDHVVAVPRDDRDRLRVATVLTGDAAEAFDELGRLRGRLGVPRVARHVLWPVGAGLSRRRP